MNKVRFVTGDDYCDPGVGLQPPGGQIRTKEMMEAEKLPKSQFYGFKDVLPKSPPEPDASSYMSDYYKPLKVPKNDGIDRMNLYPFDQRYPPRIETRSETKVCKEQKVEQEKSEEELRVQYVPVSPAPKLGPYVDFTEDPVDTANRMRLCRPPIMEPPWVYSHHSPPTHGTSGAKPRDTAVDSLSKLSNDNHPVRKQFPGYPRIKNTYPPPSRENMLMQPLFRMMWDDDRQIPCDFTHSQFMKPPLVQNPSSLPSDEYNSQDLAYQRLPPVCYPDTMEAAEDVQTQRKRGKKSKFVGPRQWKPDFGKPTSDNLNANLPLSIKTLTSRDNNLKPMEYGDILDRVSSRHPKPAKTDPPQSHVVPYGLLNPYYIIQPPPPKEKVFCDPVIEYPKHPPVLKVGVYRLQLQREVFLKPFLRAALSNEGHHLSNPFPFPVVTMPPLPVKEKWSHDRKEVNPMNVITTFMSPEDRVELICGLCDQYLLEPVMLPCLHLFCNGCVQSRYAARDAPKIVSCPTCNAKFFRRREYRKALWVEALYKLWKMMAVDAGPFCSNTKPDDIHKRAIFSCKQCEVLLCTKCETQHGLDNPFHRTRLYMELLRDMFLKEIQKQVLPCREHAKITLEYYFNYGKPHKPACVSCLNEVKKPDMNDVFLLDHAAINMRLDLDQYTNTTLFKAKYKIMFSILQVERQKAWLYKLWELNRDSMIHLSRRAHYMADALKNQLIEILELQSERHLFILKNQMEDLKSLSTRVDQTALDLKVISYLTPRHEIVQWEIFYYNYVSFQIDKTVGPQMSVIPQILEFGKLEMSFRISITTARFVRKINVMPYPIECIARYGATTIVLHRSFDTTKPILVSVTTENLPEKNMWQKFLQEEAPRIQQMRFVRVGDKMYLAVVTRKEKVGRLFYQGVMTVPTEPNQKDYNAADCIKLLHPFEPVITIEKCDDPLYSPTAITQGVGDNEGLFYINTTTKAADPSIVYRTRDKKETVFYHTTPGHGKMLSPEIMHANKKGELLVLDSLHNQIFFFNAHGHLYKSYHLPTGLGMQNTPCDFCLDNNDNIYIAYTIGNRIDRLNPEGIFEGTVLTKQDNIDRPSCIYYDGEYLLVGEMKGTIGYYDLNALKVDSYSDM